MTRHRQQGSEPIRTDEAVSSNNPFNGGKLWVGQHASDQDVLVFDPAEADPSAERLTFYSLTQLRNRTFPRTVVTEKIHELTDELRATRAKRDYKQRAALQAVRVREQAVIRADRAERQRAEVIEHHKQILESLGIAYQGVRKTQLGSTRRRRTQCHSCGIALDDFVGMVCVVCDGVLCSCGACACGSPVRGR